MPYTKSAAKKNIFFYYSENDRVPLKILLRLSKNYKIYTNFKSLTGKIENSKYMKLNSRIYKNNLFKYIFSKPGLSTITDCIKNGKPILSYKINNNNELRKNARAIKKYGIGYIFNENRLSNVKNSFDTHNKYLNYKRKMLLFHFNGEQKIIKVIKKVYEK
jgi:UDP-N-acetylglucosamine:LPS N-acetylglucosamine transferase